MYPGGGGGGAGKDGSMSQIAQGCQPGTRKIIKVGTLGYQNQLKKKSIYMKKGSAPNSAFCVGLYGHFILKAGEEMVG